MNSLDDRNVLYFDCAGGDININICELSSNIPKKGIFTLCKIQAKKKNTKNSWCCDGNIHKCTWQKQAKVYSGSSLKNKMGLQ